MQLIYKQLAADYLATWGYHRSRELSGAGKFPSRSAFTNLRVDGGSFKGGDLPIAEPDVVKLIDDWLDTRPRIERQVVGATYVLQLKPGAVARALPDSPLDSYAVRDTLRMVRDALAMHIAESSVMRGNGQRVKRRGIGAVDFSV